MPGGYVGSASMKARLSGMTDVKRCVAGERRISKLFSKQQRAFFAAHAPAGIVAESRASLTGRGVDLSGEQRTKTAAAPGYSVAQLPEGAR